MPSLILTDALRDKIVAAVAGAALLGGGTMVLTGHRDNAVQDEQIRQQQVVTGAIVNKMDVIADELNKSNQKLAEIVGYLKADSERRQ